MERQPVLSGETGEENRRVNPVSGLMRKIRRALFGLSDEMANLSDDMDQPAMLVRLGIQDGIYGLSLIQTNVALTRMLGFAAPVRGPVSLSLFLAPSWYEDLRQCCMHSAGQWQVLEQEVDRDIGGQQVRLKELVVPTGNEGNAFVIILRDMENAAEPLDRLGMPGNALDVLQGIDQPVAIWDFDDRLTAFNERLPHLFPTMADILHEGLPFRDFLQAMIDRGVIDSVLHPQKWIEEYLQRFRHSGTESMLTLADGRIIRAGNLIIDGGLTVTSWDDVSDMLRAEAEATHAREVLQDAIESCGEGIAIYDKMDRIIMYNSNFADQFPGATELMTPGTTFAQLCTWIWEAGLARNKTLSCEEWVERQVSARQRLTGSLERQYPSGRWAKVTERRMRSGGTVQIITDITDHKRQQSLLRERDRQLTARLGELGHAHRTLEKQTTKLRNLAVEHQKETERAEAASRAKSEFLAMVSHDIRTPLNGVLGMAELLKLSELTDAQRLQVETIQKCGEGLQTLLNDILDLSKIEAGRMELTRKPVKVRELLDHVSNLMQARVQEKGLILTMGVSPDLPESIEVDETRLRQIIFNLVGNAVKFTDHGSVTISAIRQADASGGDRLVLSVADTGRGLPQDDLHQIFEPFNQGSIAENRVGTDGAGLGLNICQRLVRHMGGDISATTQLGQGSTFTFWIPLTPAVDDADDPVETDVPQSRTETDDDEVEAETPHNSDEMDLSGYQEVSPRRILLADDNQVNLLVFGKMLAPFQHHVTQASNGQEALDKVSSEPFDIVLMDVDMPVMNGVEATKRIRALSGPESDVIILGLTAHGMDSQRDRFIEAGMNDVLIKPIGIEELVTTVERLTSS